jgi:hypothetical protein
MVVGVVYAPPGSASSVTYGSSNLVGSTDSIATTNSSTTVNTTSTTVGATLGLFGASITYDTSDGWTTANGSTSSVAIQTAKGNSISTMGPISSSLGVNHDNDIIYIWLNPVISTAVQSYNPATGALSVNWTNLSSNGCDTADSADALTFYQYMSGCDPNQFPYPDVIGMPVWCLKNPYYPGQGCAQWLPYTARSWDLSYWGPNPNGGSLAPGLTLQDYADILQADPFVALNGDSVNVCHPIYGPDLDPNIVETVAAPLTPQPPMVNPTGNKPQTCGTPGTTMSRFQPYGVVDYPVPGPNGLPSTYSGSFQYSQTNTVGTNATDQHTVGSSWNSTASFGISFTSLGIPAAFDAAFSVGQGTSTTWLHQSNNLSTSGNTSSAAYSITGPQLSDNYTGPATYNVYLDNVYGTYAFYSNLEPKVALGNIGISPATLTFPQATVGTTSTGQLVTLTNSSSYPLTMVWPAITFSDPGFQIANDGSDGCSNQLLPQSGTCTLNVVFAPVVSDAPNTIYGTTQQVKATMIAAGTENASSFQNILVTAQAPVSGIAAPGPTQGVTLLPTVIQNAKDPYVFQFAAAINTGGVAPPEQQAFTLKNYYSSSVTFASGGEIALTNTTDYSILSDGCAGATLPTGGSCTFTLQYLPKSPLPPSGLFTTKLTATGTVLGSSSGAIPLAFAGAAGTIVGTVTLSPNPAIFNVTLYRSGSHLPAGWAVPLTLSNNTSFPVSNWVFNSCPSGVYGGNNATCGALNVSGQGAPATNCPAVLPPASSCTAAGEYSTADVGNTGTFTGIISVTGTVQTTGSPKLTAQINTTAYVTATNAQIPLSGAEQSKSKKVPATNATATITIHALKTPAASKGLLSVKIGTFKASASYAVRATGSSAAQAIAAALNAKGSPVKATASGSVVALTSVVAGSAGNLALIATGDANFQTLASGKTLTGGKNATTIVKYDTGTVNVATGGVTASAIWGSTSTPQSIAQAIAASINNVAGAFWKANASGSIVTLTSVSQKSVPIAVTVADSGGFTPASFTAPLN